MIVFRLHFGQKEFLMTRLKVNTLNQEIELLILTMKKYIPEVCTFIPNEETDITHLMIRGFDGIIATCKEELEDSDEEHLKFILKTMCRIDVDNLNTETLYLKIDEFISHYIHSSKEIDEDLMELNEKNMITMIQLQQYANKAIQALKSQLSLYQKSRWSLWRHKVQIESAKKCQIEIQTLLEALNARIEKDAEIIIEKIVENFYFIFIFLLALTKLANYRADIVDNIAILSEIDRILYIIDPSLQGNTLKKKYLLYYHVVFELKEFRHTLLADI